MTTALTFQPPALAMIIDDLDRQANELPSQFWAQNAKQAGRLVRALRRYDHDGTQARRLFRRHLQLLGPVNQLTQGCNWHLQRARTLAELVSDQQLIIMLIDVELRLGNIWEADRQAKRIGRRLSLAELAMGIEEAIAANGSSSSEDYDYSSYRTFAHAHQGEAGVSVTDEIIYDHIVDNWRWLHLEELDDDPRL